MEDPIVNKVAESGLITLDLAQFMPAAPILFFDLKDFLFQGLILREKEFRELLKKHDWNQYRDNYVAVACTEDAIIPSWAYMLVSSYLEPVAVDLYAGTPDEMKKYLLLLNIEKLDPMPYHDQRVVIKGCGDDDISAEAYFAITKKLRPLVKSLMYGEPCSTVPVYKRSAI